jgi:curved DNA-binding protein CbpA
MTPAPTPGQPERRPAFTRQPILQSADPYAVLGLDRRATPAEIKRAYFEMVRQYSPETNPEAFKQIRAAYEKLNSAENKTETDLFLFQPPPQWEARKRRRKLDLDFDPQDILRLLQNHGDLGRARFDEDFRPLVLQRKVEQKFAKCLTGKKAWYLSPTTTKWEGEEENHAKRNCKRNLPSSELQFDRKRH